MGLIQWFGGYFYGDANIQGALQTSGLARIGGSLNINGNTTSDANLGTIASVNNTAYYVGTHTYTWNGAGFASTQTSDITYVKTGRLVVLEFTSKTAQGQASGATNITGTTTPLPSALWPLTLEISSAPITLDTGVNQVGAFQITNAGIISIYKNASFTGIYANNATIGWNRFTVSYISAT